MLKKLIRRFHGRVDRRDSAPPRAVPCRSGKVNARATPPTYLTWKTRRASETCLGVVPIDFPETSGAWFIFKYSRNISLYPRPGNSIFHVVSRVGNISAKRNAFTQLRFLRYYNSSVIHAEQNSPALFHNFSPARRPLHMSVSPPLRSLARD